MSYKNNILNWAEDDRPREKLLLKGKTSLSDSELIAVLIGSGYKEKNAVELSKEILQSVQNDLSKLARLEVSDLTKFKGIGEAKAISIVCALELGRRKKDTTTSKSTKITSSTDAYQAFLPYLSDLNHEEFYVMYLNRSNTILEIKRLSSGGTSGTVVDNVLLFKDAIAKLAKSIIVAHNHPSGNIQPSEADIKLTKKLSEAGKTLDIQLIDHLIITERAYFSFADEGKL